MITLKLIGAGFTIYFKIAWKTLSFLQPKLAGVSNPPSAVPGSNSLISISIVKLSAMIAGFRLGMEIMELHLYLEFRQENRLFRCQLGGLP
jgi:hypothetical protein